MTLGHCAERSRRQLLPDAAVTLVAVLLAFAAFDDITTDAGTTFTSESAGLAICAVWLLIVSWRMLRSGHRWLGLISTGRADRGRRRRISDPTRHQSVSNRVSDGHFRVALVPGTRWNSGR